ncbi:MAG: hypothetical protein KAU83_01640 [Bacteroidales bacterium]|nr:hypothetical protein [Bacteroidales bacterium]
MNIKRIIIPLLLILFMASMVAFGAPVYVNVGPTTEFDGDIKILSEIVAEGITPDGWETTVFFTDPTADRTITIPDYDVTVGSAILLTVTDNEATNENNAILFTSGGVEAGVLNIESDGGDFYYNPSDGSLHATLLYGDGTNLTNVGAAAATALTITGKAAENISKGEVVYISGATGPFAEFSLADNTHTDKHIFCGVAAETKTTGQVILIRVRGELAGFDTSAFADGDVLYLSTAGALTNVRPTSGAIEIIGYVSYDHAAGSIVIMHHSAHGIHVPSTDDIVIRMGDSIAAKKVYFKDYANAEVGFIDSDGKADFTSLTLDTALLIAEGGTNSAAALTNDRVMVSSGGAIIHSATITVTELGLLNGLSNTIVTDNNACTDIEGTGLSIAGGVLNWACTVNGIDSDNYTDGSIDHEHLNVDIISGLTADTLAGADEFIFHDETGGHLNKITWTNLMGSIGLVNLASSTSANLISTLSDEIGAGKARFDTSVTTKNGAGAISVAEAGKILVSAGAGYTLTLPTASGNTGLEYHFIKTDANYNLITLDASGAETFNYENSTSAPILTYIRLNTYCAEVTIVSDGTNWQVINEVMGQVPECLAYLSSNQNNIVHQTNTTVELDAEAYDIGSNFNIGTHIFTAPISGKYFIIGRVAWLEMLADVAYFGFIEKNGPITLGGNWSQTAVVQYISNDFSSISSLSATDTVILRVNHQHASDDTIDIFGSGQGDTFMMIRLISKD